MSEKCSDFEDLDSVNGHYKVQEANSVSVAHEIARFFPRHAQTMTTVDVWEEILGDTVSVSGEEEGY